MCKEQQIPSEITKHASLDATRRAVTCHLVTWYLVKPLYNYTIDYSLGVATDARDQVSRSGMHDSISAGTLGSKSRGAHLQDLCFVFAYVW